MRQTTIEAWLDWKKHCALAKCSEQSKQTLGLWGGPILRNKVRRQLPQHELARAPDESFVGLDPAWSWMEVHYLTGKKSEGKRYKDDLFDIAEHAGVEGQAARQLLEKCFNKMAAWVAFALKRDLHEQADAEGAKRRGITMVSLQAPVSGRDDDPTFEQLCTQQAHEGLTPESAEQLAVFAQNEAQAWFAKMELRDQLALGAHFADRSLSDPTILQMAGVGSSQFYLALSRGKAAVRNLRTFLETSYGLEHDADTVRELVDQTCRALSELCVNLLPPENPDERHS